MCRTHLILLYAIVISNFCCSRTVSEKRSDLPGTKPIQQIVEIIGGRSADPVEFPYMVALGYGTQQDPYWNCGGFIISDKFVLTAAHCLYSREDGDVKFVRAGTTQLINPPPTYRDYSIVETIPHPNYTFPAKYHDLALLKLNSLITFGPDTKIAPLVNDSNANYTNFIATGWGSVTPNRNLSDRLMEVDLVRYDYDVCKKYYEEDRKQLPEGIKEDWMICAGGKKDERKDTCFGDSGGPLQVSDAQYKVVAVTSFGRTCGTPNIPAVYTKLSSYMSWIQSVISK